MGRLLLRLAIFLRRDGVGRSGACSGVVKGRGAEASGSVVEAMAQENVVEIFEEDWAKGQEAYQEEFRGVLDDD